jgi:hypothetical protein
VLVQLGTSDPFVRFEVHHWHVESEVKPGTLNPVWLNDKGEEGQVGEPTTTHHTFDEACTIQYQTRMQHDESWIAQ